MTTPTDVLVERVREGLLHERPSYSAGMEALYLLAARVRELEGALQETLDIIVWMSGATAFGPGGEAEQGWKATRVKLDPIFLLARAALPEKGSES